MTPSVADIQRAVCDTFGIAMLDMLSDRRSHAVAHPRQVAMYLARHLTPLSLPAIGRHFGNRDHTTVIHACRTIQNQIQNNHRLANAVGQIRDQLEHPEQPTLPFRRK